MKFVNYSCSQKGDLKKHVVSVHEEKKPFKCEICDYSCSLKNNMKRHVESVHEGKKAFKCDLKKSERQRKQKKILDL